MPDDELVERRARRNEDSDGSGAASGAPDLLPRGRDGSRIADEDRGVEAAYVDAELECVGADHAGDAARTQARLYLATMQR